MASQREANLRILAGAMSEEDLQAKVMRLLGAQGWLRVHFRPARTKNGWRTAVQGDGDGFPDVIALRGTRQLAIELKSQTGSVTAAQRRWLAFFKETGAEVFVWRPLHWLNGSIDEVLA